jgi:hypothetical protein
VDGEPIVGDGAADKGSSAASGETGEAVGNEGEADASGKVSGLAT